MKQFAVSLAMTLIVTAASPALARIDRNPDAVPSLGFQVVLGGLGGETTVTSRSTSFVQDASGGVFRLALDGRVPLNANLTLIGGASLRGRSAEREETADLAGVREELGGLTVNLGVRFYFQ